MDVSLTSAVDALSLGSGESKYSGRGLLSVEMLSSLDLPLDAKHELVKAANQSLAVNTHSSYAAGVASYTKMCRERQLCPEFPLSARHQLLWQAHMSSARLSAGTMRVYWAGVSRVSELISGQKLVKHQVAEMAIRGAQNMVPKKEKLAVTWPCLREIKRALDKQPASRMTGPVKKMIWAVCVCAMVGSFRLSELLPTRGKAGRCQGGLLRVNLRRLATRVEGKTQYFYLARLVQPKERKGANSTVDVELFANGTMFCPVQSVDAYLAEREGEGPAGGWAFTNPDGTPFTKLKFNKVLRKLLKNSPGYKNVAGHSFRRGVPSLMAKCGYSDSDIARQGRWKSDAWQLYTVTGRAGRLSQQHALHTRLAALAEEEVQSTGVLYVIDGGAQEQ